jgi:outer membrane protein assembly factor BamB
MVDWHKQEKWLRYTAYVALGFAALMSVLVILNYLQLNRIDPVNTEVINDLVVRLQDNPSDQQLREQIWELDLLARKAYFTNRWQVRYGAYIILISLSLFVIIYQLLLSGKRQQVIANPDAPRDVLGINQSARRGIAFVGDFAGTQCALFSLQKPPTAS